MAVWSCKEAVPFAAMAAVEFASVGVNTLYKAATLKGLNYFVFVAYSYVLGTLVLLPLPFIFPRRDLPSFQLSFFLKIVLLGLIGFASNICAYKGIQHSSPTLASAVSNITPAFTFILAVIFRMENLDLTSSTTHVKIIGTIFSISGALIAVLYKGPVILSSASSPSQSLSLAIQYSSETSQTNWVLGGLLLASEYLMASIWYILQTQVMKIYPDAKVVVPVYFLCTSAFAVPICFIAEPNLSSWTPWPEISLIAIVLSGLFGTSFSTLLHTWGLHLKGPLYISIFRPLSIAIAAAFGVVFLGDDLFLGRMEVMNLRSSITRIKIIGTVVSISGALVVVLYKGPAIISPESSSPQSVSLALQYPLGTSQTNWVIGGLLLVSQTLLGSIWSIFQMLVIELYPDEQIVTLVYFLCKTIIAVPICFLAETKWSAWTLKPDMWITVIITGLFGPSFGTLLCTWGLHLKGPLYISIFKPFSIAVAAVFGVIFLGDALCLGSVLGATILLLGFYAVIWGKAQVEDTRDLGPDNLGASPDRKTPLLQSYVGENLANT